MYNAGMMSVFIWVMETMELVQLKFNEVGSSLFEQNLVISGLVHLNT
jgi:hypothetical protein